MEIKFRTLTADEIDLRIGRVIKDKGVTLLLYKDSRVDMNLLDEVVGAMKWKREHSRDNANCTVSIYDDVTNQWVSKEDTGKESNQDAEKGLASDSFKRACVNWGIGRELYTAPEVIVWGNPEELKYEKFTVSNIEYNDKREISKLVIVDKNGAIVYDNSKTKQVSNAKVATPTTTTKQETQKKISEAQRKRLFAISNGSNDIVRNIISKYGYEKTEEIKVSDYEKICNEVENEINTF